MTHLLHPRLDLTVDDAPPSHDVPQQGYDHGRQQVIGLAHVGVMAQDARASKITIIGVVVLDGVKEDRQAGILAPDGDRRLDAVHLAGQLDVHQDHVRQTSEVFRDFRSLSQSFKAIGQSLLPIGTVVCYVHGARLLQTRFERAAQFLVVLYQQQV
jgi:hypothetical protein